MVVKTERKEEEEKHQRENSWSRRDSDWEPVTAFRNSVGSSQFVLEEVMHV